jgi:hypothetical protein
MKSVANSHPGVIQNAITANQDGTYNVKLYLNGAGNPPTSIKVSPDNLPRKVYDSDGNLRDAISLSGDTANGKQEIWPNLIEKALIQAQGGTFQNRSPGEFMTMLTGKPSDTLAFSAMSSQQIANNLKAALNAGNPAIVWTPPGPPDTFSIGGGKTIVNDHAYTVTAVDTKNMTVNLRNPWGREDLIGIPISDLRQYFDGVQINQMQQQKLQASAAAFVPEDRLPMPAGSSQLPTTLFTNMDLDSISPLDPVVWPTLNFVDALIETYGENGVATLENYNATLGQEGNITLFESGSPLYTFNPRQNTATMLNLVPPNSLEVFRDIVTELKNPLEQEQTAFSNSQPSTEWEIGD